MKILITGFKPFLNETVNPSEKLATDLAKLQSLILPVEFKKSFEILKTQIENQKPDYLIMLGQAAGRKNICLEKIALNWQQSEHADESGHTPKSGPILLNETLALMSIFPIEAHFLLLKKAGFPVEISFSAGTFVCNHLYYRVLNEFKTLPAVFVHVPLLPEQLKSQDQRASLDYEKQFATLSFFYENLTETK